MNWVLQVIKITFLCLGLTSVSFSMENVFYVLHDRSATQQALPIIKKHVSSISILISQAYHFNNRGEITGYIDPELVQFAQVYKIKLMALITNSAFNSDIAHSFLTHPKDQDAALNQIIALCKKQQLYGVQFDLEMVNIKDKTLLTAFYQKAAQVMHKNNLVVSFAVGPKICNGANLSAYQSKQYKLWIGAFDLEKLGAVADFITIMTYDQHIGVVTPGPVAGIRWVEEVIRCTLKSIPANKISLGVPSYTHFWYTGATPGQPNKIRLQGEAISYEKVQEILKKRKTDLHWDPYHKVHYAMYEHNWLNEYIFVEDLQSFKAKLDLIKKYHLRGFSLFRIGVEDPRIWNSML